MSSFLVMKPSSGNTQSYTLTSTCDKPRLAVSNSYVPIVKGLIAGLPNLMVKYPTDSASTSYDVGHVGMYSTFSSSSSSSTQMTTGYAGTSSRVSYYQTTSTGIGALSSTTALTKQSTSGYSGISSKVSNYNLTDTKSAGMSSVTNLTYSATTGYTGYLSGITDRLSAVHGGTYNDILSKSTVILNYYMTPSTTYYRNIYKIRTSYSNYKIYTSTTALAAIPSNMTYDTVSRSEPSYINLLTSEWWTLTRTGYTDFLGIKSQTNNSYNEYSLYSSDDYYSTGASTPGAYGRAKYEYTAYTTRVYARTGQYLTSSSASGSMSSATALTCSATSGYSGVSSRQSDYYTTSVAPGSMTATTALTRSSTSGYSGSLSTISYYYTESSEQGNMSSTTALTSSTSASTSASTTSFV